MGIDRILDWILSVWENLVPWFIVKEYEEAVVLRWGRFNAIRTAGMHFKIPFADEPIHQHVVVTTINTPSQSLVTKDGKNIVTKSIIKYRISDVKMFLLEVYDTSDALSDVTQGIIKNIIMSSTWEECISPDIDNTLTKKVRVEVKKFGVHIENITLTDIAQIRTLKLMNQTENIING